MDLKKNLFQFKEFIKTKYKFAQLYSNQTSKFAERDFRSSIFKIKSDLSNDLYKDEFLYIPINFARAITWIYTNYVIGMWYSVDFWSDEVNDEFVKITDYMQLQKTLNEACDIQSSIWYTVLRARKKNNDEYPRVEIIPLSNYCANMEWLTIGDGFEDIKEHFVYSVVSDEKWSKYFYVDRYEKKEGWEWWIGYYWEKRVYTPTFILSQKISEWVSEPLEFLPLFLLNNDLLNIHVVESDTINIMKKNNIWDIPRYFHQSDYVDLCDLFQEINDRTSQISVEYIKNLTSKMSVPASFIETQKARALKKKSKDWDEWFIDIPDYISHNVWETPAQYIQKDWQYLQTSINDWLPYLLKIISVISKVPASLLWASLYWATSSAPVWTTEKEFSLFYSRVEKKQLELYNPLQKLFRFIMKLQWKDVELPTIKFKKPTAYDISEKTQTAIQQMNAWIMSKESAIAFAMWYDDQETQEELDKIQKETEDAYKRDWSFLDLKDEEDEKDLDNNEDNTDESTTV